MNNTKRSDSSLRCVFAKVSEIPEILSLSLSLFKRKLDESVPVQSKGRKIKFCFRSGDLHVCMKRVLSTCLNPDILMNVSYV